MAEITIWKELFEPGENYLASLLATNFKFDFAILVMTPDDDLKTRDKNVKAARDNVIFEMGLCLGRLGARRSYIVLEQSVNLPSDLAGIHLLKFKENKEEPLASSLAPVCEKLTSIISRQYQEPELGLLPSTGLAIGYFRNFLEKVFIALSSDVKTVNINGKRWKNQGNNFHITIIIPESLAYVDPKYLQLRLADNHLKELPIKTKSRSYPLYIKADVAVDDQLLLFDLPTTLFASMEAIDKVIPDNFTGAAELKDFLQIKELRNFKKTLEHFLNKKGNELLKEKITVQYREEIR